MNYRQWSLENRQILVRKIYKRHLKETEKKNWQKKRAMKNSMPRIYTLQNLSKDWKILNLGMTIYEKVLTACLEIHGITFNSGLRNIIFKEVLWLILRWWKRLFQLGKVLVCQPFPPSLWTHDAVYLLYVPKCMKWDISFKNTWQVLKSDTACTH